MQVSDVMTCGVECVRPEATIAQAAERMRELNVGSLPVCTDDDQLVGMITDRDITVRATAAAFDPVTLHVSEIMTPDVVHCFEDDDITQVARLMELKQIRRIVVLNRDDHLVGVVSLGDLAVKSGEEQLCSEALEQVSEPAAPRR